MQYDRDNGECMCHMFVSKSSLSYNTLPNICLDFSLKLSHMYIVRTYMYDEFSAYLILTRHIFFLSVLYLVKVFCTKYSFKGTQA